MILQTRLLSHADAVDLAAEVEAIDKWRDGHLTAAPAVRDAKHNEQLTAVPAAIRARLAGLVRAEAIIGAVGADPMLGALRFGRYKVGHHYGWHVDVGYITAEASMSFSLMLREAVGGAIRVRVGKSEVVLEPKAGEAVLWPSNLEHCVEPVEDGCRIVALASLR